MAFPRKREINPITQRQISYNTFIEKRETIMEHRGYIETVLKYARKELHRCVDAFGLDYVATVASPRTRVEARGEMRT